MIEAATEIIETTAATETEIIAATDIRKAEITRENAIVKLKIRIDEHVLFLCLKFYIDI